MFKENSFVIQRNKVPSYLLPIKQQQNKYYNPLTKKYIFFPNIGSFQITLNQQIIFSKKKSNTWPVFQNILNVISLKIYNKPMIFKPQESQKLQTYQSQTDFSCDIKNVINIKPQVKTFHKNLYIKQDQQYQISNKNKNFATFTLTDHFKTFHHHGNNQKAYKKSTQPTNGLDSTTTIKQYPYQQNNSVYSKNNELEINVEDIQGLRQALRSSKQNFYQGNSSSKINNYESNKSIQKRNQKQILINLCSIEQQSAGNTGDVINMDIKNIKPNISKHKKESIVLNQTPSIHQQNSMINTPSVLRDKSNYSYHYNVSEKSLSRKKFEEFNNDLKKIQKKFKHIETKINKRGQPQNGGDTTELRDIQSSRVNYSRQRDSFVNNNNQNQIRELDLKDSRQQIIKKDISSPQRLSAFRYTENIKQASPSKRGNQIIYSLNQNTLPLQIQLSPRKPVNRYDQRYLSPSYYEQNELKINNKSKKLSQIQKYLKSDNEFKNKKLKRIYGDWKVGPNNIYYMAHLSKVCGQKSSKDKDQSNLCKTRNKSRNKLLKYYDGQKFGDSKNLQNSRSCSDSYCSSADSSISDTKKVTKHINSPSKNHTRHQRQQSKQTLQKTQVQTHKHPSFIIKHKSSYNNPNNSSLNSKFKKQPQQKNPNFPLSKNKYQNRRLYSSSNKQKQNSHSVLQTLNLSRNNFNKQKQKTESLLLKAPIDNHSSVQHTKNILKKVYSTSTFQNKGKYQKRGFKKEQQQANLKQTGSNNKSLVQKLNKDKKQVNEQNEQFIRQRSSQQNNENQSGSSSKSKRQQNRSNNKNKISSVQPTIRIEFHEFNLSSSPKSLLKSQLKQYNQNIDQLKSYAQNVSENVSEKQNQQKQVQKEKQKVNNSVQNTKQARQQIKQKLKISNQVNHVYRADQSLNQKQLSNQNQLEQQAQNQQTFGLTKLHFYNSQANDKLQGNINKINDLKISQRSNNHVKQQNIAQQVQSRFQNGEFIIEQQQKQSNHPSQQHSRSSSLYQQPTYCNSLAHLTKNSLEPCNKCTARNNQQQIQTNRQKIQSQRRQKQLQKQKRFEQNRIRRQLLQKAKQQFVQKMNKIQAQRLERQLIKQKQFQLRRQQKLQKEKIRQKQNQERKMALDKLQKEKYRSKSYNFNHSFSKSRVKEYYQSIKEKSKSRAEVNSLKAKNYQNIKQKSQSKVEMKGSNAKSKPKSQTINNTKNKNNTQNSIKRQKQAKIFSNTLPLQNQFQNKKISYSFSDNKNLKSVSLNSNSKKPQVQRTGTLKKKSYFQAQRQMKKYQYSQKSQKSHKSNTSKKMKTVMNSLFQQQKESYNSSRIQQEKRQRKSIAIQVQDLERLQFEENQHENRQQRQLIKNNSIKSTKRSKALQSQQNQKRNSQRNSRISKIYLQENQRKQLSKYKPNNNKKGKSRKNKNQAKEEQQNFRNSNQFTQNSQGQIRFSSQQENLQKFQQIELQQKNEKSTTYIPSSLFHRQRALILNQFYNLNQYISKQLPKYNKFYDSNELYQKVRNLQQNDECSRNQENISFQLQNQTKFFQKEFQNVKKIKMMQNIQSHNNKSSISQAKVSFQTIQNILSRNIDTTNNANSLDYPNKFSQLATTFSLFNQNSIQINHLKSNIPHLTRNLHKVLTILAEKNELLIVRLFQDYKSKTNINVNVFENLIIENQNQLILDQQNQEVGYIHKKYYGVWLCINQQWKLIVVNNLIPTLYETDTANNASTFKKPFFSYHQKNQLWPIILQKSLALAVGSYQKLFSLSIGQIFTLITGSNYLSYTINQNLSKNKVLLKQISQNQKKNFVMICQRHSLNLKQQNQKLNGQTKVFYLLSKKVLNSGDDQKDGIILKMRENSNSGTNNQEPFYIKYQKFCETFKTCYVLHLRQHYNFTSMPLSQQNTNSFSQTNGSSHSKNNLYVVQLNFDEPSFGTITVCNEIKSEIKTYLYKLQNSDNQIMKLVGEAQKTNKKQLFFDCCFQQNKYYLFIQCSNPNCIISYMGQGKPQMKVKQQILQKGLRNRSIQYLPVSSYEGIQAMKSTGMGAIQNFGLQQTFNKTKSSSGWLTNSKIQNTKKPNTMQQLRQMFVQLLLEQKKNLN